MRFMKKLTLEQAKTLLLTNCPPNQGVIGTHDLLTKCEKGKYYTDTIRYAYWTLVGSGELVRVPKGVYKR